MYSSPDARFSFVSRPGSGGPVTCAACGCRLQPIGPSDVAAFFHFGSLGGRDARGCRVACSDLAHDASGHPVHGSPLA